MDTMDGKLDSVQVDMDLAEQEALSGVPDFLDIPDELKQTIEEQTMAKERLFWLRATHILKDMTNSVLLRRAIYAEQRCLEMEMRLAETALIAQGLKGECERLSDEMDKLVKDLK